MLYPTNAQIPFAAQFTASKAGATGLTVTVSVYRLNTGGTVTTVVSGASATEIGGGVYAYQLAGGSTGTAGAYVAVFHTAGTADLADIPALELVGPAWVQTAGAAASPAQILLTPANLLATDSSNRVTVGTNADKAGYALSAGEHTAVAADTQTGLTAQGYTTARAGFLDTLNGLVAAIWGFAGRTLSTFGFNVTIGGYAAGQDPATLVLDPAASGHNTAGTIGQKINAAGGASDPLTNVVPGTYTQGTAGYALGRIGSGQIVTVSPVAQNGNLTLTLGQDYFAADGRGLTWTDTSAAWPDLATISALVFTADTGFSKACTVLVPSGANKKVQLELSAANLATLGTGPRRFDIIATLSTGHLVALVQGVCTINPLP